MIRYLELPSESGTRFCRITAVGNKFIKIEEGEVGQAGTISYCLAENLIQQKVDECRAKTLAAGYTECTEPVFPTPVEYQRLLDSKDLVADLKHYFAYLVDSEEIRPEFNAMMEKATAVKFEGGLLVVQFENKTLYAWPPEDPNDYPEWPESFRQFVAKHRRLAFPQKEFALEVGYIDEEGFIYRDDYLEVLADADFAEIELFADASEVKCPFADHDNFMFYHPEKVNSASEPALFLVDTKVGKVNSPTDFRLGSQFIRRATEIIAYGRPS